MRKKEFSLLWNSSDPLHVNLFSANKAGIIWEFFGENLANNSRTPDSSNALKSEKAFLCKQEREREKREDNEYFKACNYFNLHISTFMNLSRYVGRYVGIWDIILVEISKGIRKEEINKKKR